MITRLSTAATPGRNYGSFAGKETSIFVTISGIVTLLSKTLRFKADSSTAVHTKESSTPKHTVS